MAINLLDSLLGPTGGTSAADRALRLGNSLSGTNLERAADYNQRVVLQVIRRHPEITRAEIAALTGLTAPAIANITARLLDGSLVVEAGRRHGLRGQPAIRLAINPDGAYAIGLNIDRDHVTLVTLDLAGRVRSRFARQAAFAMPEEVREMFREGVEQILADPTIEARRVLGVGVAMPDDLGQVTLPHRPSGYEIWGETKVETLLAELVPWSFHIDNDAAAAAIGEAQFGSGGDHVSFFYILVSAGLGGGLVIDGSYYRGATGRSGEIGFLSSGWPGTPDGALQDFVSVSALTARLERAGIDLGGADPILGLPVAAAPIVEQWIDDAARRLAPILTAVNALVNPDAVLFGGRLPDEVLDRLAEQAATEVARGGGAALPVLSPIRRATLSRDAPAVGAAILPFLDRMLPSDATLMK